MTYTPKVGDRVRVVLEGPVTYKSPEYFNLVGCTAWSEEVVSVEKVEPPVEVFGPGDVVRGKASGTVRALGDTGYINLTSGRVYFYGSGLEPSEFTSEKHERVEL